MRSNRFTHFLLTVPALLIMTGAVFAGPIIYNTNSDFTAQLAASPTVIDFTVAGGEFNDFTSAGYQTSGVKFLGYQSYTSADSNFNTYISTGGGYDFGTGAVLRTQDPQWSPFGQPYFQITLPGEITAVGFNIMTYLPTGTTKKYGYDVNIWITDAFGTYLETASTVNKTDPPTFFGIVNPTAILSIKVEGITGITIVDNFTFGLGIQVPPTSEPAPGETPEVATIIMIVSGLAFLRLGKRRIARIAV
jgi:hypothetical protein